MKTRGERLPYIMPPHTMKLEEDETSSWRYPDQSPAITASETEAGLMAEEDRPQFQPPLPFCYATWQPLREVAWDGTPVARHLAHSLMSCRRLLMVCVDTVCHPRLEMWHPISLVVQNGSLHTILPIRWSIREEIHLCAPLAIFPVYCYSPNHWDTQH